MAGRCSETGGGGGSKPDTDSVASTLLLVTVSGLARTPEKPGQSCYAQWVSPSRCVRAACLYCLYVCVCLCLCLPVCCVCVLFVRVCVCRTYVRTYAVLAGFESQVAGSDKQTFSGGRLRVVGGKL